VGEFRFGDRKADSRAERNNYGTFEHFVAYLSLSVKPRFRPLYKVLGRLTKSLLWRPLLTATRVSSRRAGLVLMYHLIADRDGDPLGELVPPTSRRSFARQLVHLRHYYSVVELQDLQSAVAARRSGDPFPVALTFDDDLGNHVTHALPELRAAGTPATFFLCGSFLQGQPRDFWWQRLQRAVDEGADLAALLGNGSIHQLGRRMEALKPENRDVVDHELDCLATRAPESELLTMQNARRLPHIGFHTIRHDKLTELNDEQLARALTDGRAELSAVAGYPIDTIAYPHGWVDARVVEAARAKNFTIGVTCRREAVTPTADPLAFGRYEPPARVRGGEFAFDLVRTLLKSPA
jgi:peptidoglycan/xylan/chitin deacetylase (PgdA/CDA1 family)